MNGWPAVAVAVLGGAVCLSCGDATSAESEFLLDSRPTDADFDTALWFDGIDDYASVGTARFPQIERAQTIALWLAPEASSDGAQDVQVLFTLRRGDYSGIVLALDGAVPFAYNVWGRRELARALDPLPLARWQHLTFVIEPDASLLYVDGVEVARGNLPATNRTPITAFIGSLDGFVQLFRGALDDLRLYDRAFSAEEVAALAGGQSLGDPEPLILHLPFDEVGGARSYDRSGLGNHALLGDGVPEAMPSRVRSRSP
jgi:hypothetical protein